MSSKLTLIISSCFFIMIFSFLTAQQPPNIVFIAVDDLKPTIGSYGDAVAVTPNLDYLSRKSTVFLNAHTQQAICSPSRVSLLTGKRPDYTKVWDLKTKMRDQNPTILTIPQHFKQNGYRTIGVGKIFDPRGVDSGLDRVSWSQPFAKTNDLEYHPDYGSPALGNYQDPKIKGQIAKIRNGTAGKKIKNMHKFITSQYKPPVSSSDVPDDAYTDGAIAKYAVSQLEVLRENKEQPFFLAVGFKKPHLPFSAPQKYWNLYQRDKMPLAPYQKKSANKVDIAYHSAGEIQSYLEPGRSYPVTEEKLLNLDEDFQRELIHGYYACVSFIDFQIGKIINKLKETGLDKNTIIIVWGDHGWHLGDHSLWAKHSNFEQATRSPLIIYSPSSQKPIQVVSPTEFVDIFPTLCELAGIETPNQLDGTSLAPIMNRTLESVKEVAVSQYNRGKIMGYSFRSTQFRYTVWLKEGVLSTHLVKESDIIAEEFYDYKTDPLETQNLINDDRYNDQTRALKKYAFDFFNPKKTAVSPTPSKAIQIQKPIKEILVDKGYNPQQVYIGATLNHSHLGTEIEKLFLKDFTYSTPENCAKQSRIHPKPNVWDWSQIEDYLSFAKKNNITLRIHGPISPQASRWAKEDHRTHKELNTNMVEYFTALCKKINGHSAVKWMDVVNETITPEGEWFKEKPGTTQWENPWEQLGHDQAGFPLYISKAFEIANQYAPDVSLVFNQHGGMEPIMWDRVKKTILYLKENGYRVDGVGWQAHMKSNQQLALDEQSLRYFSELIDWAHQNDLDFHVTEIDYKIPSDSSDNLTEQSNAYSNILKVLLSKTKTGVVTFNTWGLLDGFGRHHDRNRFLYNKQGNPKPAYYGLKNTLMNPFDSLVLKNKDF